MKILHISARYKNLVGGDAIYLDSLVNSQIKLKNKVYIFTAGDKNFELIYKKKPIRKLSKVPKNFWNLNFHNSKVSKDLDMCIEEVNPDVIHIHGVHQYFTLSVLKTLRKFNHIKKIFTVHDYKILCGNAGFMDCNCINKINSNNIFRGCYHTSNMKSLAVNMQMSLWYLSDFFNLIDIFHCGSQFVKELIERNPSIGGKAVKVRFPYLTEIPKSKKEISYKKEVFFIGRLVEHKGIEIFLRSLCNQKDIKVRVFGDGPLMPELKNQYSNFQNLHFEGWKTLEQISKVCSTGSIVVAPFLAPETFCYSILESLSRGNVVVAFKSGAIPELIKNNNGILVENDEIEIRRAVLGVMNNPEQRKFIARNAPGILDEINSSYEHAIEMEKLYKP